MLTTKGWFYFALALNFLNSFNTCSTQPKKKVSSAEARNFTQIFSDEKKSRVSGYFIQSVFNGQISVRGDTYYIEPSPMNESTDTVIIYREKDIIENRTSCTTCSHTYRVLRKPIMDHVAKRRRSKRHSLHYNSCPLLLAADSLFYQHIGKNSVSATLAKMAYYVSEADEIFRSTIFFEGQNKSIGFVIASLVVYQDHESDGMYAL